jgi:isopentenyl-diphosphate Delta-isomerase
LHVSAGQNDPGRTIRERKEEHLRVALDEAQARESAGWSQVQLVHRALPEIDFDDVDLATVFLRRPLNAPFVITGMTGGHEQAVEINARLARAAQAFGIAMGMGSQRAALRDPSLSNTYAVARREAPDALLIANLGAAQLIPQADGNPGMSLEQIRAAVDMIKADALAVHLNFLEETVQPEGDRRSRGCLAAFAQIAAALDGTLPLVAKETGAGISAEVARELRDAGAAALDVGGRGGTSFAAIESRRAAERGDTARERLGRLFDDWGIPTPVSVVAARSTGLPVIATGGVRSGLDAAKALSLGANLVGIGRPLLVAAVRGEDALRVEIEQLLLELRTAMFLTGSGNVGALTGAPKVILGDTQRWLEQLDLGRR